MGDDRMHPAGRGKGAGRSGEAATAAAGCEGGGCGAASGHDKHGAAKPGGGAAGGHGAASEHGEHGAAKQGGRPAPKKYVFVTGGVISGLGKGIVAASLGRLLKSRGYSVTMQKFDPYLNVDAGTMNPFQHGEVFVTSDGAETDLDLGHYERFIDEELTRNGNVTSGSIYGSVIDKERLGVYDGNTVQIVPHITNEIKERIAGDAEDADFAIIEIGGTVGDIESMVFLEAIRQFSNEMGKQNCAFVHVLLLPYIQASGEQKTKPAQHSVKELLGLGISPDFLICRSERPLTGDSKDKIALFCNVSQSHVITNEDVESIYEVPLRLHDERFDALLLEHLGLESREPGLAEWRAMVGRLKNPTRELTVALVGKYTETVDAYFSILEALRHSGALYGAKVRVKRVESSCLTEETVAGALAGADGVLVPGGFGSRGIEGMILAARHARENGIPYLGLCLGMQIAAIEFARNVLGLADADSTEFAPGSRHLVIDWMPEQKSVKKRGGTMRLGHYPCELAAGSLSRQCYGEPLINERHRHRYEFNNDYREAFEKNGVVFAGRSPDNRIIEICEMSRELHPWFVGVQFHPEFKSRPNRPHPLFCGFVEASLARGGG
ncbi:MAG: CTP synthase, partial [Clostridiales bacterium]|nr:CTP synthase [Clostridiales bacterium]